MGLMTFLMGPRELPGEFRGPLAWLLDGVDGGRHTRAGVGVSPSKALALSEVFACVRVIGEDLGKLPLVLYERLEPRGKRRAAEHPLYAMLHDEPNPEMGSFDFRQALSICAALWGSGYAEIERTRAGDPLALWPLAPWRVKPERDDNRNLVYRYREGGGEGEVIPARDMIHLRGPSVDGLVGLLITDVGAEALGLAVAAHDFTASFFRDGTSQRGVVKLKGKMQPEALREYRQQFQAMYAGALNSHGWMAIDNDADITTLTTDPEKSQLIETMRFSLEQICRYFRVSPHKVYDRTRAQGWSTLEMTNQEHLTDSLLPWLVRLEQELWRKLLPTDERRRYVIEHLVDAILRADTKSRYDAYSVGIQGRFLLPNEAREKENLNPIEGGDAFPEPEQAIASETLEAEPAASQPDEQQTRAYMMPVFADAAGRLIARETLGLSRQKQATPEALAEFYAKHQAHVVEAVTPPLQSLGRLLGAPVEGLAERFAANHCAESIRRIQAGEDPQQWPIDRPARMAEQLTNEVSHVPALPS